MGDDDFFGDIYDPIGIFDLDNDGEHSEGELALAIDEFDSDERDITDTAPSDDDSDDDMDDECADDADSEDEYDDDARVPGETERLRCIREVLKEREYYLSEPEKIKRCEFLLANCNVEAIRYINDDGRILYGQYANDNFSLPVKFKSEDETPLIYFGDLFHKIERFDINAALGFWKRRFNTFMPYCEYLDSFEAETITCFFECLEDCPEYREFATLITDDSALLGAWASALPKIPLKTPDIIKEIIMISRGNDAAFVLEKLFSVPDTDCSELEYVIENVVECCTDYDDVTAAYGFIEYLCPVIRACGDAPMQKRLEKWIDEFKSHIDYVESNEPKYAYTGKNEWRNKYRDNSGGLDPTEYESESELLKELEEQKNAWKKEYTNNKFGVNIDSFDNENDYLKALDSAKEKQDKVQDARIAKLMKDKTEYTYYGVMLPLIKRIYYYFSHTAYSTGDAVIVPANDGELVGTVVSVGKYLRISAPFPPEQTKYIIGKKETCD